MKRYLVFSGERYYPWGGAHDLYATCNTLEEARKIYNDAIDEWRHVYDCELEQIIDVEQSDTIESSQKSEWVADSLDFITEFME